MILVSAGLLGLNCRFDGQSRTNESLISSLRNTYTIPFCPEQLGGLPTPRHRAWITHGDGKDVSEGRSKVTNEGLMMSLLNLLRALSKQKSWQPSSTSKKHT